MKLRNLLASLLLTASLAPSAWCWFDTGHMVVASIAEDQLSTSARAEADRLLKIGSTDKAYDFITAAPWADDTKTQQTGPWHYYDVYFRADGGSTDLKPDPENAIVAIDRFSKVLADKSKPDADRADALRYLIHIVGDLHQPLHAVSRVTDAQPTGDRGGNSFQILPPDEFASMSRPPRNLHALWDFGAGLFTSIPRPLTVQGRDQIVTEGRLLEAAIPASSVPEAADLVPLDWVAESVDLSKRVVYDTPEGQKPSQAYLANARQVVAKRITVAGYRLGALLNKLLG